jgi:hypothetical protein
MIRIRRIRRIRRLAGALAAVACTVAGLALSAPAAFASPAAAPWGDDGSAMTASATQTVTRVVVMGGMPGWQIALIAAGAALLAAALSVLAYRAVVARRTTLLPAA